MRWLAIAAGCTGVLLAGCFFDEHGVSWDDGGGQPGSDARLGADARVSPDAAPADATPTDATPPTPGFAVALDGKGDYVRTKRLVGDDFTIEGWIRTTDSRNGTGWWQGAPLFYADVAGAPFDDFGVSILHHHLTFGVGNPDTTLEGTSAIDTGDWVHVAVTRVRSTGTITVFVNGVREASLDHPNHNSLDDPEFIDLGGNTINNNWLAATIDEVRVWNVARSESQIAATMSKRLTGSEAGLVGYWRFDDGSGATAIDSSPSSDDGQLQDNATFVPSDLVLQP